MISLIDNPFRFAGKDAKHCNDMGKFIDIMGIDYSKPPPIIEHFPNGIRDKDTGKTYFYICLSGAHTHEALEHHSEEDVDEWIYDEYSYDSDKARQTHIARINGSHPPSKVATPNDAINHTTKIIREEKLDLGDLKEYITNTYPSVSSHDQIIAAIKRKFDYRDEALYTAADIKTFMINQSLGVGGKIVNSKAQWACKEGYEDRRAIQSLLKYAENGIFSDIHVYVNGSTDSESLSQKRWKVVDEFEKIEEGFLKLFKKWKKTGSIDFPWKIKDFVAQRNKEGETGLLTFDEIEPRKNKISEALGIV